jgi:DNA-binding transcriptional ArsR family regulator
MTIKALNRLVQINKALAHPVRLRLLALLREGPLCVCQMTAIVRLAASTVSEHLSELRRAGLVIERKEGRWVEYRLAEAEVGEHLSEASWERLQEDPDVRADAVLAGALRAVPVEELGGATADLGRLGRARLTAAVSRATRIRLEGAQ